MSDYLLKAVKLGNGLLVAHPEIVPHFIHVAENGDIKIQPLSGPSSERCEKCQAGMYAYDSIELGETPEIKSRYQPSERSFWLHSRHYACAHCGYTAKTEKKVYDEIY